MKNFKTLEGSSAFQLLRRECYFFNISSFISKSKSHAFLIGLISMFVNYYPIMEADSHIFFHKPSVYVFPI